MIGDLRFVLFRNPTIIEVAYKVGKPPEIIREEIFRLASKLNWKEPTAEEIKKAEGKIKEVLEMSTLMKSFSFEVISKRPAVYLVGNHKK